MADKLQRELSTGISTNCNWWCYWYRIIPGRRCFYSFSRTIHITYLYYSRFYIIYVYESDGRIALIELRFQVIYDIAHHHIGSMAGFMVGWTYWLT